MLKLKPAWYQILLSLAEAPAHGAEIRRTVLRHSRGEIELYPVTLYGALDDLHEEGLIKEVGEDEGRPPGENPRHRYYGLTPAGTAALRDETRRLTELVGTAERLLSAEGP